MIKSCLNRLDRFDNLRVPAVGGEQYWLTRTKAIHYYLKRT